MQEAILIILLILLIIVGIAGIDYKVKESRAKNIKPKPNDSLYGNENCKKNLKYNNCPTITKEGFCSDDCIHYHRLN